MYAYICKQPLADVKTKPLQIDGKNIAFFIEPIKAHATFLSEEKGQRWFLSFFKNSPFPQTLTVHFYGNEPANFKNEDLVGRACSLNNGDDVANNSALLKVASSFLRNSETLGAEKLEELTDGRGLVADRDGIAYFSNAPVQFERVVLCQALAIAYTQVLYECLSNLTRHIKSDADEETLKLYEKTLRFNAADYFSFPVDLARHELFAVWQVLTRHYKLQLLSEELTRQLSDVATLLRSKRDAAHSQHEKSEEQKRRRLLEEEKGKADERARIEKRQKQIEDKKDKRRSFWLSLIGIFLTASSLTQATPKQIGEALNSWKTWWQGIEIVHTAAVPSNVQTPPSNTLPPRKK